MRADPGSLLPRSCERLRALCALANSLVARELSKGEEHLGVARLGHCCKQKVKSDSVSDSGVEVLHGAVLGAGVLARSLTLD